MKQCPLLALSGHSERGRAMSAFRGKADIAVGGVLSLLIATDAGM